MDGIGVPSRFSCLKIEDDEIRPIPPKNNNNSLSKKGSVIIQSNQKKNENTKGITATDKKSSASVNSKKSKKSIKTSSNDKQWEDWKERDSQLISDNFEQDLENAIIQSNLEYIADKAKNGIITSNKNKVNTPDNKKKKGRPMSLNQFLDDHKNDKGIKTDDSKQNGEDESYFEKLAETAKKEVKKGKVEEERKERQKNVDSFLTLSQLQDQLNKEKSKNSELQKKLNDVRSELGAVKTRNKTLCNILGQAEMKDKAELVQELERLNVVKDELTEEVGKLHKLLEQERSKATNDSHNKKIRKKNG